MKEKNKKKCFITPELRPEVKGAKLSRQNLKKNKQKQGKQ
jgi:methylthioribose-1-phosphate isomerase